jgi:hypothetical protein
MKIISHRAKKFAQIFVSLPFWYDDHDADSSIDFDTTGGRLEKTPGH